MKPAAHFCPHCGKRFRLKKRKTGARLRCPSCAGEFLLNAPVRDEPESERRKTASGLTLERNSEAARLSFEALRQIGDLATDSAPSESSDYLPAGQDPTRFGADDSDSNIEEVSDDYASVDRKSRRKAPRRSRSPRAAPAVYHEPAGDGLAWGATIALVLAPLAVIALCLSSTVRDRGFAAKGALGGQLEVLGRRVQRGVLALDRAGPGWSGARRERSK